MRLGVEEEKLLLGNSISPIPTHKMLVLLQHLERGNGNPFQRHEKLALAKALVHSASNIRFGPEVGVGTIRYDAPIPGAWMDAIRRMAEDLRSVSSLKDVPAEVFHAGSRRLTHLLDPGTRRNDSRGLGEL